MKNLKNCIILSVFVSILLMPITFHLIDIQGNNKNDELEFGYLNSAGSWVLAPFAINPYGTRDYTWIEANATEWCSGAGTELDPWIIENVTIDSGGLSHCLEIGQSVDYFIIRNCTFNNAYPNYGIYSWSTSNGIIEDCTFFDNLYGVYISGSAENNTVQHNYFYNNTGANVRLSGSSTCINNTISNNIFVNRLTATLPTGLRIQGYNNKIINNTVDNFFWGVNLDYAHDTIIKSNTFISSWRGISMGSNNFNATVFNNTIRDNHNDYGVYVNGNGSLFYRNRFINNNINAKDNGNFNRWDNEVIGNYWDDYGGLDLNDDGIGDTAYILPDSGGSQDNYPIWDDGFNGTKIHIDDTGVNSFDWESASKLIWCTGSGTYDDPYTIQDLAIDAGNVGSPIFIESSSVYFVIENCNLTNSQATGEDAGIKFEDVYNGKIVENNITDNYAGVKLIRSDNNSISANYIYDNTGQGIVLQQSKYNVIAGNTANNSNYYGLIIVSASHNNTIEENTFGNNKGASGYGSGIKISGSNDCEISENLLSDNDQGIRITDNSHGNKFYDNVIHNNAKYGILIQDLTRNCNNSVFYNNSLKNPLGINAYDNGSNSEWDNGIRGNFWNDYEGADNNGDGIGDTPYLISGDANRQDNYPIWNKGDEIYPTISINSPSGGSIFGTDAPTYSLNIFDLYLNSSWYTLNNSATRYFFTPSNGNNVVIIDETGWDIFSDGSMLMTFYINDTGGNIASVSNMIEKDVTNPTIALNSPIGGTVFGSDAPQFNLTIFDLNLHDAWYTIGSSVTPHSFSPSNGINIIPIDESSWDTLPDGSITIDFFVNDIAGNIHTIQVILTKDLPSSDPEPAIPFGDYYILFLGIGIAAILVVERKKRKK